MLIVKHFRKIKKLLHYLTHPIIGKVWELHRVTHKRSTDVRYAPYDITPERLESLIVEYQKNGYTVVPINEIVLRLKTKTTWTQAVSSTKCIAITLDDGYGDNYEVAYPIFRKYHIPFCIYVSTGYIDKDFEVLDTHPHMLTTEQLKVLAQDPLCTIGAHTVSHPVMSDLSLAEQKKEIEDSVENLHAIIGKKIQHFAIPFGEKNDDTLALLQQAGICSQVDAWGGPVRRGMSPMSIPRYIVEESRIRE